MSAQVPTVFGRRSPAAAFLLAIALLTGLGHIPAPAITSAAEPPVSIMPLGDSITDGLAASHFCCGVPGAYRINLDGHLRAAGYAFDFVGSRMSGPQPDKDHEGHPGYRIDEVHAGGDEGADTGVNGWLTARPANVVLLMIGTNDILQNFNVPTAPDRLSALIDRIIELRPTADIYVASIPPLVGAKATLNAKVLTYNAAVRDVVAARAAAGKRVRFVDVYPALGTGDFGSDGIHPNRAGHDKIANVWAGALLGAPPPPPPPPPDTTPPSVTGRTPAPGATAVAIGTTVAATFSEQLDPATVNSGTVTLSSAGGTVSGSVAYNSTNRIATFTPSAALANGTTYTATVRGGSTGVKDLAGNALASNVTWQFTTAASARSFSRLAGVDRYETAAAISAANFGRGLPVAFVATGANFPDALAAGPAAATSGGPVLLTRSSVLPQPTRDELARLQPSSIVVLGGTGVVSDAVLSELRGYSASVSRIAGADRYATAAAISAAYFRSVPVDVAYIATGANFPDALAGGAAAGFQGGPILLTRPTALPAATGQELARLRPARIVVLGGPAVVGDGVLDALRAYSANVSRIFGADRYATAAGISAAGFAAGTRPIVYVATGSVFPDGLAAAPVAGRHGAPLLLTAPSQLPAATAAELRRLNPREIIVLGSTGAVSETVVDQMRALWP